MKKSAFALVLGVFAVLLAAASSAANTFTYPSLNPVLTITFPDNWTVRHDPDAKVGIIASSPGEDIEINLWMLEKRDVQRNPKEALDDAVREVASLIVYWVDGFAAERSESFTFNGIEFYEVKGTAKDREDGSPVKVVVDFFSPDNRNIFVMMYWGAEGAEVRYANELAGIARSIRKP